MTTMPTAVFAKLTTLEQRAHEAESAVRDTPSRIAALEQRLPGLRNLRGSSDRTGREAAAREVEQVEAEVARLRELAARPRPTVLPERQLVDRCREWLASLPPGSSLEAVPGPAPQGRDLAGVRADIAQRQQEAHAISSAPPPPDRAAIKARARALVEEMAQRGRPTLVTGGGTLELRLGPSVLSRASTMVGVASGLGKDDVVPFLAWLMPDALLARLEADIDAIPASPHALPEPAKGKRLAALAQELERLERLEEALAERTGAVRRPDASPPCVLGVRLATAASAAAA